MKLIRRPPLERQDYRAGLPLIPRGLLARPVHKGIPVPWFNAKVHGQWDFRYADHAKLDVAIQRRVCWLCGQALGTVQAFIVGPIGAMNRISAEPPSHRDCATFAIYVCPFLRGDEVQRRTTHIPDQPMHVPPGGIPHNPGVVLLWVTRERYRVIRLPEGTLCQMPEPTEIVWYRQGRLASSEEVRSAIHEATQPIDV